MTRSFFLADGWGALNGAIIFSPGPTSHLPVKAGVVADACEGRWPGRIEYEDAGEDGRDIHMWIQPEGETGFHIDIYAETIGLDGTSEQNVRLAAWLRSLMPEDSPRLVVADGGVNVHAELPHGVTPEQVATSMVDHSVEGWDADDPQWRAFWNNASDHDPGSVDHSE